MTARIDTKMPAANGVAKSSTSTFKLPIGRRFHNLTLIGAGTAFTVAHLTEIRVMVNEKVIQRFSGDDRDAMNVFDGRAAAAVDADSFMLVLPFDRYGMYTIEQEEATALNTGSVDPATGKSITAVSIEVDISSGPTAVASLDLYAQQSPRVEGGPGLVPYIHKVSSDYSSADSYSIPDMPRGGVSTMFLDKLFLKPSTGTLSNILVQADNYKVFERTVALNNRLQSDGIRVPQAGWYVIDRTEDGRGIDPLDLRGLTSLELSFTTSAALTLKRYAHYLGGLAD